MGSALRLAMVLIFLSVLSFCAERPKRTIALTFDDLPLADKSSATAAEVEDVNRRILRILRKHKAPAIGFVNEKRLDVSSERRVAALESWLSAGQTLGNHTYSHPDFDYLTLAEFIADAVRGETVIRPLLAKHKQQLKFFRFPFNHAGDTAEKKSGFEKWLTAHGYEVATCTVENSDWLFNRAYVKALDAQDTTRAAKIRAAYLDFTNAKLRFFEKASVELAGREFAQVFLAHANRLNADTLDELLTGMERGGYRFVTLETAQSDPVYRTPDNYVGTYGPMWVYRWAPALGKKIDGRSEPEPLQWIVDAAETSD